MKNIITNANHVKKTRVRKGLSVRMLADKSGLNPSTIWNIENGRKKPNPQTAIKLCNGLGKKFDDLFELDMEMEEKNE